MIRTTKTLVTAMCIGGTWLLVFLTPSLALASTINVAVFDRDGNPVPNVAVVAESLRQPEDSGRTATEVSAVMDQVDVRFNPHILIVQAGTAVEFPNSDTVAHHVYSFSRPNDFRLPIYKGNRYPPVVFGDLGTVTLGCNIHDEMLAYVLVVDTPDFGKTNLQGTVSIPTRTSGEWTVRLWSPRLREAAAITKTVETDEHGDATVRFDLLKKLRRPHDHDTDAVKWGEY